MDQLREGSEGGRVVGRRSDVDRYRRGIRGIYNRFQLKGHSIGMIISCQGDGIHEIHARSNIYRKSVSLKS